MANYVYNKVICPKEAEGFFSEHEFYFSKTEANDGFITVKFCTRWRYPITEILELFKKYKNKITWYAVEENNIFMSRFEWINSRITESTLFIEDDYYENWFDKNTTLYETLDADTDDDVWYCGFEDSDGWKEWICSDFLERHLENYPAEQYYEELESEKHFYEWHKLKQKLHKNHKAPRIKEGEVWWCSFGENIGVEINGKSIRFTRPVLIMKKLSHLSFMGVPLTSKIKSNNWYTTINFLGKNQSAAVCQSRTMSVSRLHSKMGELPKNDLNAIKDGFHELFK